MRIITTIPVKFKHWDTVIHISRYANNGNIALSLNDAETQEPIAKATVNTDKMTDEFGVIKDHSENEGMLQALLDAEVVEVVEYKQINRWVTAPVVRFTNELAWEIELMAPAGQGLHNVDKLVRDMGNG
ncbi:hypothetical protein CMI47_12365 [Candidatus Pacearchaeota archaeon]|jgi:hypothetical protein|nr:hypothetical protein [Candidatus Pacearchaeota archaeon]|tara:strand:- start:182 stop:568 length:387 start_codon:yes stop_codon:yes gene_type:complete